MALNDDIHAYALDSIPGLWLCLGRYPGRTRPAMWLTRDPTFQTGQLVAHFNADESCAAVIHLLDRMIEQINLAIDHHQQERRPDENDQSPPRRS